MPTPDEIAQWRARIFTDGEEMPEWVTGMSYAIVSELNDLRADAGLPDRTIGEFIDLVREVTSDLTQDKADIPRGQLNIKVADAAAQTISDTSSYHEITTPAWTLSTSLSVDFDESDGNGRLTYTGSETLTFKVTVNIYALAAAAAQTTHWRIGVNGTTESGSEVSQEIGTTLEQITTIAHEVSLATGDHVSLFVRNATAVQDVTPGPVSMHALEAGQ